MWPQRSHISAKTMEPKARVKPALAVTVQTPPSVSQLHRLSWLPLILFHIGVPEKRRAGWRVGRVIHSLPTPGTSETKPSLWEAAGRKTQEPQLGQSVHSLFPPPFPSSRLLVYPGVSPPLPTPFCFGDSIVSPHSSMSPWLGSSARWRVLPPTPPASPPDTQGLLIPEGLGPRGSGVGPVPFSLLGSLPTGP